MTIQPASGSVIKKNQNFHLYVLLCTEEPQRRDLLLPLQATDSILALKIKDHKILKKINKYVEQTASGEVTKLTRRLQHYFSPTNGFNIP